MTRKRKAIILLAIAILLIFFTMMLDYAVCQRHEVEAQKWQEAREMLGGSRDYIP